MSTAISELKTATALSSIENTAKAIAAAAQEEGANELGTLLKYSKGHFIIGTDEVPMGTEYIAHVEHWVRGFVKFRGGSSSNTKSAVSLTGSSFRPVNNSTRPTRRRGTNRRAGSPRTRGPNRPISRSRISRPARS